MHIILSVPHNCIPIARHSCERGYQTRLDCTSDDARKRRASHKASEGFTSDRDHVGKCLAVARQARTQYHLPMCFMGSRRGEPERRTLSC